MAAGRHLPPTPLLDCGGLGEGGAKPVAHRWREEVENLPHVTKYHRVPGYKQVFLTAAPHTLHGVSKYPFERLTEDSKRVLVYAQHEAEEAGDAYIGTEHVLLAMFRLGSGSAHRSLTYLGLDELRVRGEIERARHRRPHRVLERLIPTSRVKHVIELAFEESLRTGSDTVHSGHLLSGLAKEGEGIAAHVLKGYGAGPKQVIAAVEREVR